jgi:hypothetical protein
VKEARALLKEIGKIEKRAVRVLEKAVKEFERESAAGESGEEG